MRSNRDYRYIALLWSIVPEDSPSARRLVLSIRLEYLASIAIAERVVLVSFEAWVADIHLHEPKGFLYGFRLFCERRVTFKCAKVGVCLFGED
ncbi:hypothetical protein D3C72_96290 [compost metagenome]